MKKLLWTSSLLLITAGCLKPHYERPDLDIPCEWRMESDEGSSLCNIAWWEQFEDPVLNELIGIALQNNQDLKIAITRVLEYYARLGITNSALYPQVSGNGSFYRTEVSLSTPVPPPNSLRLTNDFQGFFAGSFELDFWGRIRSASEASYAELLAQVAARRTVVMTVVSQVANSYIILRQLDSQLDISRKTLATRLDSLKLAKDRFELGETSEIEVKQAESEVEIAATRVIEFERDIPKQENLLSILLGENPRSIERGIALEAFQYPTSIPAGLPADLLIRRPDIVQAEQQLIAANARVTQARALFFPQINLTGQYGSESDDMKAFLTSPAEMWQYGFTLAQTIFDAGRVIYQVDTAKELREEAIESYRQTILVAFKEVEDALVTYTKDRDLVVEHQKQVQVLKDYLHLAELRYAEGEIDYLNVLDAERQLFSTELDLVQAQSDTFIAIVKLYSALGGGWVYDADAEAISKM